MSKTRATQPATQQVTALEEVLRLILDGETKGAEAKLDQVPISDDEFTNGYKDALRGILNSLKSGDHRSFVLRLKKDRKFLRNEIARLKETEASHLCTEWDLGYFKCWTSYLQGFLNRPSADVEEKAVQERPEE